jgi:hypothetical protein
LFFDNYSNESFFFPDRVADHHQAFDLKRNGVCIIPNMVRDDEADHLVNLCKAGHYESMKEWLHTHFVDYDFSRHSVGSSSSSLSSSESETKRFSEGYISEGYISEGYVLQDYIWIIQKSSVHTCHRDNNGDFFNNLKHPSYTLLIYLEDPEKCLGVIPDSHHDLESYNYNLTDRVVHLPCKKGDAILFNANLIHVGAINGDDSIRVQLKVSHLDDIEALSYYENYNKVLNETNHLPVSMRRVQKRFSCMLPALSNWTQSENIRTARGSDNGVYVGPFQKMFSFLFYGNPDYYDLPNAF